MAATLDRQALRDLVKRGPEVFEELDPTMVELQEEEELDCLIDRDDDRGDTFSYTPRFDRIRRTAASY